MSQIEIDGFNFRALGLNFRERRRRVFVSKQTDPPHPLDGWRICGNCRKPSEMLVGVNYDTEGDQGYLCLPCLREAVAMLEQAQGVQVMQAQDKAAGDAGTTNNKESKP